MDSDRTLLLPKVAQGDAAAIRACVEEYGPLVYRLASRYLSARPQDVEDAVQDAFIEVWRSASRFDPALGSEAAFIATIAHRRLTDTQRRVRARAAREAKVAEQAAAPRAIATPGLPMDARAVAAAFDGLPEDERVVLFLHYHRGLSHSELAAATQSPIGTIKTRLRRGLARLAAVLNPLPLTALNAEADA